MVNMFGYSKTIEILETENTWLKTQLAQKDKTISDLINQFVFRQRPQNLDEKPQNTENREWTQPSPIKPTQDQYSKALRLAEQSDEFREAVAQLGEPND